MKYYLLFVCILSSFTLKAIKICGTVCNLNTKEGIAYVNIGILKQGVGTVSNDKGMFQLDIDDEYMSDSIRFSCIGFEPRTLLVQDLIRNPKYCFNLIPQNIPLSEVVVNPINTKEVILGNKFNSKRKRAGFKGNLTGSECGVLISINKKAYLKTLICNIAVCSFDSLFLRVNVYEESERGSFNNILSKPIFIKQKVSQNNRKLIIDLSSYNVVIDNPLLVTLEYIKDLGKGELSFSAERRKGASTYFKKVSQDKWQKSKVQIGFNVIADVEN